MIKKIEINNVGRFKSLKMDGDEQYFKKNTFIYGKNTFGKSTLTAIFRSLKENKPDYIVGRKTIGSQKQTVKIIPEITTPTGEYRYTTEENKWNAEYKDIIIFDSHFVRESVYTQNQQIGQEQQKNIEAFMLGAEGAEYLIKIASLTEQISENTKIQASTSAEYNRSKHLFGGLSFDVFLGLNEVADIKNKIEKEEKELDKVKNSELILNKLTAVKVLLGRYTDFDTSKISEKLTINAELITKHFNKHINKKENKQTYSTFLQTGARLRTRTENECCPFCTQDIKSDYAKEFFETIDLIYNEKYEEFQQAIRVAEGLFQYESFSVEIEEIKTDLHQAGYELEIDFSDVDGLFIACKKSITKKKEDLSSDFNSLPFTDIFTKSSNHITTIDAELVNFQNPSDRKSQLENSLKELFANKERFGSWKQKCVNYVKAKSDSKPLSDLKSALWDEYLVYAKRLSTTMLADMNTVLNGASCNFSIKKFNFKGNQRQDLLVLNMDGSDISNDGNDCEMTVKNCLSDSDKWVLALAFFLATVKNNPTVKVVVMDDPVSSFDVDRKRIILNEIKRVFTDTDKQLILLTHEKGFFQLIHAESVEDKSVTFLKISLDISQGSYLINCNPYEDHEFMNQYNCWISDMREANISQDISIVKSAHSYIRPVIEHILKVKYPLELTREHTTVGKMVTKLEQHGGAYELVSQRSSIGTILTNLLHHDNSGVDQYPISELGLEDYKKDIRDAFEIIKGL